MVLNDDTNMSVTWERLISNPEGTEDAKGVRCGGAWLISVPGRHSRSRGQPRLTETLALPAPGVLGLKECAATFQPAWRFLCLGL